MHNLPYTDIGDTDIKYKPDVWGGGGVSQNYSKSNGLILNNMASKKTPCDKSPSLITVIG